MTELEVEPFRFWGSDLGFDFPSAWDLEFGIWDLISRPLWDLGFGIWDLISRPLWDLEFGIWDLI
jgi:hypothetical protein